EVLPGLEFRRVLFRSKTEYTLSYIEGLCYVVPFHDLTKEKNDGLNGRSHGDGLNIPVEEADSDLSLAEGWKSEQISRLASGFGEIGRASCRERGEGAG